MPTDAHPVLPSLLPKPPREIRRRKDAIAPLGCLIVFLTPFFFIGIWLTVQVPIRLFVQAHGTVIPVIIDGTAVSRGRHGNNSSYFVRYHYSFNGQTQTDRQQVSYQELKKAQQGRQVPGRAMQFGPWMVCLTSMTTANHVAWQTALCAIAAGVFDTLLAAYFSWVMRLMARQRWLVRQGTACIGLLVDHRIVQGKSKTYYLNFRFKTSTGHEINKEIKVLQRQRYESAEIGSSFNILYDPAQPDQSVVYEYSDYEVVPHGGMSAGSAEFGRTCKWLRSPPF